MPLDWGRAGIGGLVFGCMFIQSVAAAPAGVDIRPRLKLDLSNDSNVLAATARTRADQALRIAPGVELAYDRRARHFDLDAEIGIRRYRRLTSENAVTHSVSATLTSAISRRATLSLFASDNLETVPRGAGDDFGETRPVRELGRELGVGIRRQAGKIYWRGALAFQRTDYLADGSALMETGERRGWRETAAEVEVGYAPASDRAVYLRLKPADVDFDLRQDGPFDRTRAFDWSAGLKYADSGPLSFEARVGKYRRKFDDPDFDHLSGVIHQGSVNWRLSRRTRLAIDTVKHFDYTRDPGSPGGDFQEHRLRLTRRAGAGMTLQASAERSRNDYLGIRRSDAVTRIGAEVKIEGSRHLEYRAAVGYEDHDLGNRLRSETGDISYQDWRLQVGVTLR